MGIGSVVFISVITVVTLGALRRLFGWRRRGWGGHGRGRGRWGERVLDRVLDELEATGAQRDQVKSIKEQLVSELRGLRSPRREILEELLIGLEAEKLDAEGLDRKAEELFGKARAGVRKALEELHRTLTPVQRKRAVELARRRLQPC